MSAQKKDGLSGPPFDYRPSAPTPAATPLPPLVLPAQTSEQIASGANPRHQLGGLLAITAKSMSV